MIRVRRLNYSYKTEFQNVEVLKDLSFDISAGEMVAIQGPSGSGKSTLLYLLGALLKPTAGFIEINGQCLNQLDDESLAKIRQNDIGFVFQQFHLLPRTSVVRNVLMSNQYSHKFDSTSEVIKAESWLKKVYLFDKREALPHQLSGGQQQRVAIARALFNDPPLILADEPTGNLDSQNAEQIISLFRSLNKDLKKTIVIITHDTEVARRCDRILHIKDGRLEPQPTTPSTLLDVSTPARATNQFQFSIQKMIEYFPDALKNLYRNKVRSVLTMLGVSVGIASVFSLITIGTFTKNKLIEGYDEMGVNTMIIYGYKETLDVGGNTKASFQKFEKSVDLEPLRRFFTQIEAYSPLLRMWESTVSFAGRTLKDGVRITGIEPSLFTIQRREFLYGRPFTPFEVANKSPVCVITEDISEKIFGSVFPLKQVLRISSEQATFACKVIGVLKKFKSTNNWMNPTKMVALPHTYFSSVADPWTKEIHEVIFQLKHGSEIEKSGDAIVQYFKNKYGSSGSFFVNSDSVLVEQMKKFLFLFSLLLVFIALVTLSVGGIGITNMMLVSVTDRYREIGLRKAVGAPHSAIRHQFLAESLAICSVAGVIGLFLGFITYEVAIAIAAQFTNKLSFEWIFDPLAFFISLVSIIAVGLLSGLYPALKAEKLDVIEALRSE